MLFLGWVFLLFGVALYGFAVTHTGTANPLHKDYGLPLLPGFFVTILGVTLLFFHYHPFLGLIVLAGMVYGLYHMAQRHGFIGK